MKIAKPLPSRYNTPKLGLPDHKDDLPFAQLVLDSIVLSVERPLIVIGVFIQHGFLHLRISHQESVHSQGLPTQLGRAIGNIHSVHLTNASFECLHVVRAVRFQCSMKRRYL